MANDSTRSIDERVDEFPEAWMPSAGDKLVGMVTGLEMRESEYHETGYPLVSVVTDGGDEITFHGFHTVAKNELARQRPTIGDRIAIKYFGRDDERGYEKYRILVERAAHEPDAPNWDAIAAESAAELARPAAPDEFSDDEPPIEDTVGEAPPVELPMGPSDAAAG